MGQLIDSTLNPLLLGLQNLGFKKRAGWIFTLPINPEFAGRFGLNLATEGMKSGEVTVSPIIGLRHEPTEKILSLLSLPAAKSYLPATLSVPLGEVMPNPRYRYWTLTNENALAQSGELLNSVERWGLDFLTKNASKEAILRLMAAGVDIEPRVAVRRPILLALAGKIDEARTDVDRGEEALGPRNDLAAESFRQFGSRFRTWISQKDLVIPPS